MFFRSAWFVCALWLSTNAHASIIQLDFHVVLDRLADHRNSEQVSIPFDYSMQIDTQTTFAYVVPCCGDGLAGNTTFASLVAPPTPVTADVLAHATQPLMPLGGTASIYREWSAPPQDRTF